jgi:hypothetical protein
VIISGLPVPKGQQEKQPKKGFLGKLFSRSNTPSKTTNTTTTSSAPVKMIQRRIADTNSIALCLGDLVHSAELATGVIIEIDCCLFVCLLF